jgi:hypothetical protein
MPPIMGEEKIYVIIVPVVCAVYTRRKIIFRDFFDLATGGGGVAQEEESREFHNLLYSKQGLVTVALIVLAMIIFTVWE